MPRLTKKLPAYRLPKPSGQAIVTLDGGTSAWDRRCLRAALGNSGGGRNAAATSKDGAKDRVNRVPE
jgi:hypothetical protein